MNFQTIRWEGGLDGHCVIIDQTLLPEVYKEIEIHEVEQMAKAIKCLAIRGAPALGVAGAYGMVLALAQCQSEKILDGLDQFRDYLNDSRPTAVNLSWATNQVMEAAKLAQEQGEDVRSRVLAVAQHIDQDDRDRCLAIGDHGAHLVPEKGNCLTHCNAGALATAGQGTALSVFYSAHREGKKFRVFADETRPLLQGSRLTAWELHQAGIDVTVISDSMAGSLMTRCKIDLILVGADRIAANGDTANKIGTYPLAVLAQEHSIPFYVAAPLSTFDFSINDGSLIPIEERESEEIKLSFGQKTAPEEVLAWNPAFDVTPYRLIHGFITEKGIVKPTSEGTFTDSFANLKDFKMKSDCSR